MPAGPQHDVIVVGGGPAGLSAALHLASHAPNARLLLLEKEQYPREKYCAGALGARGDQLLARLGVRIDVPAAPVHALSLKFSDGATVSVREPGDAPIGRVVRRLEFDHALARAALDRGIEVRQGTAVRALRCLPDRVVVELENGGELSAACVVGADGVSGVSRRTAGFARAALRAQVIEVDTEAVAGDPDPAALHFDLSRPELPGYGWDFPTVVAGQQLVCRGVYRIGADGGPVRALLAQYLAERGLDIARYRLKQYAERGFCAAEPLSRPRVLLIGEAAGIDIATGEGIPEALAYGELAAHYLAAALCAREFGFADWSSVVRASPLGRRLALGERAARWFYGSKRAEAERLIRSAPELVRIGCRDFAGLPIGASLWTRGLLRVTPLLARHAPRWLWKGRTAPHQQP